MVHGASVRYLGLLGVIVSSQILLACQGADDRSAGPAVGTSSAALGATSQGTSLPGAVTNAVVTKRNSPFERVPGEILVKVKDSAANRARSSGALATAANPSARLAASVPGFDRFVRRHPAKAVEHLFRSFGQPANGASQPDFDRQVAAVRAKFPARAQRVGASPMVPRLDTAYKITLRDRATDLDAALRELRADPDVQYAVPNQLLRATYTPNDPLYASQWAHQVTSAPSAWDVERGSKSVIVAVVDTGVDYTHEDLRASMLAACDGGCPSGKGYDFVDIDTALYESNGWQLLAGEDYTGLDNEPRDFNGHGTHCTGIVAAAGNNGIGVSGVAPGVSIMPVRAGFSVAVNQDEYGILETDDVVNAIRYAADNGADVISMSFGGSDSPAEKDAIAYASNLGVVLVAAAGNAGSSDRSYPAAYDGVIAVAATGRNDSQAFYSNYGTWVDLAAPGGDQYQDSMILSTVPRTGGALADPSGYRALQGTSMATPYVAGAAALVLSRDPTRTPAQVESVLKRAVDRPESTVYVGTGRIDLLKAVQYQPASGTIAIDGPAEGALVTGANLPIVGSVQTSSATPYGVYVGAGLYPRNWTLVGTGTAPVTHGVLANWDLSTVANDATYTIEVELATNDPAPLSERAHIVVSRTLHAGWPQSLDLFSIIGLGWANTPTLADVDGDGRDDVFIGSNEGVWGFKGDGSPLPGWPQRLSSGTATNMETPSPAVGDIDDDGQQEVVIGLGGVVAAWSASTGQPKPGFPVWIGGADGNDTLFPVLLADLDNDRKLEIVVGTGSLAGGLHQLYVLSSNGAPFKSWPYTFDADHDDNVLYYRTVGAFDVDGDGKKEVLAVSDNGTLHQPSLYVWSYDGALRKGYPLEFPEGYSYYSRNGISPVFADIDDDGQVEMGLFLDEGNCIYHTGVLTYKHLDGSNVSGWPMPFMNQVVGANASLADLDKDGKLETIFGTGGLCAGPFTVHAFRSDGTPVPGWPVQVPAPIESQVAVADIDDDGYPEVIAETINGQLHAWTHTGQVVPGFPKPVSPVGLGFDATMRGCPAVGDVDGDGKAELVAATGSRAFIWDLAGASLKDPDQWSMSLHDPLHGMAARRLARNVAQLRTTTTWETGYCAEISVKNTLAAPTNGWSVDFDVRQSSIYSTWSANFARRGSTTSATPMFWNQRLAPQQTAIFGFCANKTGSTWQPVLGASSLR